jgi:hypothetical protein
MKNLAVIMSLLACTTVGLVNVSNAQTDVSELIEVSVDIKCYSELVGGAENVTFWKAQPSLLHRLSDSIIGQKVRVTGDQSKNKKGIIYKVHQCVLLEDEFSSPIAKAIDKKTRR